MMPAPLFATMPAAVASDSGTRTRPASVAGGSEADAAGDAEATTRAGAEGVAVVATDGDALAAGEAGRAPGEAVAASAVDVAWAEGVGEAR
jgi:hypothetical protein